MQVACAPPAAATLPLLPSHAQRWSREGATWAAARADNATRRDFTVNGLLYDPFNRLLFDAVGGVGDCAARRLRTICPPGESFERDPARILRGVRLAARAGKFHCRLPLGGTLHEPELLPLLPLLCCLAPPLDCCLGRHISVGGFAMPVVTPVPLPLCRACRPGGGS
jgi:hypothetical protein